MLAMGMLAAPVAVGGAALASPYVLTGLNWAATASETASTAVGLRLVALTQRFPVPIPWLNSVTRRLEAW